MSGGAPPSPNGQTPTRRQGDIHAKRKGCCQEQHPYRYTRNQRRDLTPGRGARQRIWGTLNLHQQPIPGRLTPGRAASKPPHAWKTHTWKTPRWKESPRGRRSRPNPRGGREATGPEEERPRPTPSSTRWTHTESTPEAKTTECGNHFATEQTGQPKDDTKTSRGLARKTAPKKPNWSDSFIRDQIGRSRPDRGDSNLKESRAATQSRLRYDWVWENSHDPQGDPIVKQRRIDKRKKPSFRSSAQKSVTRPKMSDPNVKAWRQPLGKVRKESSFRSRAETKSTRQGDPIVKQRRIDKRKKPSFRSSAQKSVTRPKMSDPNVKAWRQPLGKVRKESSFRSRAETKSTRQGDPIAKTPTKHQEGGGRVFIPIEDWDRLDSEGWPHREDLTRKPKQRSRRNSTSER